jgi:chitinase
MLVKAGRMRPALVCLGLFLALLLPAQERSPFRVIAYYAGSEEGLAQYDVKKLTDLIYCFGHLKGNRFHLAGARDTAMIRRMVALKAVNPQLRVLLSLGGWGGCAPCSDVFSTRRGRREFAASVRELNAFLQTDGIDLDWEYPAIEGHPGHRFRAADRRNFTRLVETLRKTLGAGHTISFAAGGFHDFLERSIEWKPVMRRVDFVNVMSYDLVNGYATTTGHHTALYSTPQQRESTDHAVQYLVQHGVRPDQIVIGGAFYARIWENVPAANDGLYQPGKFKTAVAFRDFPGQLAAAKGFEAHWDETAQAPWMYNPKEKLFVTYDDRRSIGLKTRYARQQKLGGIMFWELSHDLERGGLVDSIIEALNKN